MSYHACCYVRTRAFTSNVPICTGPPPVCTCARARANRPAQPGYRSVSLLIMHSAETHRGPRLGIKSPLLRAHLRPALFHSSPLERIFCDSPGSFVSLALDRADGRCLSRRTRGASWDHHTFLMYSDPLRKLARQWPAGVFRAKCPQLPLKFAGHAALSEQRPRS